MRSFARIAGTVVVGLMALLFVVAPTAIAAAAEYTPSEITAPPVVPPGGPVNVTGTGFLPAGSVVTVSVIVDGVVVVLGTTTSDANGDWTYLFDAPEQCGTYPVIGSDGVHVLETTITVPCQPGPVTALEGLPFTGASEGLPFTGASSTVTLVQIGASLVAMGALIALFVRKRRNVDEKVKVGS